MFDDLIPAKTSGGMFDDLIPAKTSGGVSDDLMPAKPTPQQIEAMGAAGLEAERKAAEKPAIITKAPMPSKAKIEEATKKSLETKIPFEELYKNPELFGVVKDYMKVSRNIEPEKGQTDEDFVKKYMATMWMLNSTPSLVRYQNLIELRMLSQKTEKQWHWVESFTHKQEAYFNPVDKDMGHQMLSFLTGMQ